MSTPADIELFLSADSELVRSLLVLDEGVFTRVNESHIGFSIENAEGDLSDWSHVPNEDFGKLIASFQEAQATSKAFAITLCMRRLGFCPAVSFHPAERRIRISIDGAQESLVPGKRIVQTDLILREFLTPLLSAGVRVEYFRTFQYGPW